MNKDINSPRPDLRTTPIRRAPWSPWIAIVVVVLAAALAWNFWPIANPLGSSAPSTQTTTTQPPASSTPPAAAPAQ